MARDIHPLKGLIVAPQKHADDAVGGPQNLVRRVDSKCVLLVRSEGPLSPDSRVALATDLEGQLEADRFWPFEQASCGVKGIRVLAGDEFLAAVLDPP